MYIDEAARLEEGMGGMGQGIADARNSPYQVGPGPQVQPFAQALHALPFLAEGVLTLAIVTLAQPQDLLCLLLEAMGPLQIPSSVTTVGASSNDALVFPGLSGVYLHCSNYIGTYIGTYVMLCIACDVAGYSHKMQH